MKKIYTILLIFVLLVAVVVSVSCDYDNEESLTGELPTLAIGDKWVSRVTSEGIEYTMTIEVTGENVINGIDCFIVNVSYEPSSEGIIHSTTVNYNKETMFPVTAQALGENMGMPFIIEGSYSHEFPSASRYPREVGKEYEVMVIQSTTITSLVETNTETDEQIFIYKVEKIEEITVPAGTFKCFKEVQYDETGETAIETTWYSDKVKFSVKKIDYENGATTELLSYSVR